MTLRLRYAPFAALLGSLLACNSDSPPGNDSSDETSGSGGSGIMTTAPATSSTTTSGADSNTSSDSMSDGSSSGGLDLFACNRVDFIFVVDNSLSMMDEQMQLAAGVPAFVTAMQNTLPITQGFRVGVIDTDSYPALGNLETPLEGCPSDNPDVDCASCDYQLGAFLDKPNSATDPATSCDFSTTLRYMDGQAETFPNEFGCAAIVGANGNPIEQQAGALVAAVSEDLNGSCNDDFMRDSALLVFLVISDEEDNHNNAPEPYGGSQGDPADWYEAVVAAKGGKAENIVALGLVGGSPRFDDCEDLSVGVDGAEQSSRLVNFLERFPQNFVGSVCSDGYGDFFEQALGKVSEGCMNFIP